MQVVSKFKKWPLDPDHALFEGILSCLRLDLRRPIRVPSLKFLASPVPNLGKGFLSLKIRPWTLTAPFLIHLGLAKIYLYTNLKFLASPVSDLWEGG